MSAMGRAAWVAAGALAAFTAFGTGLVALTWQFTAGRIEANQRHTLRDQLAELLPAAWRAQAETLLSGEFSIAANAALGLEASGIGWRLRDAAGVVQVVILPAVAPDGYSGDIRLLIGVDRGGLVTGVRVLEHHETPGLGDPIEARRSDWIHRFTGLSLGRPPLAQWRVKKDGGMFDQFTGATITPRAVVGAVRRALQEFEQNRAIFLDESSADEASA